jgi:hypothetical protein
MGTNDITGASLVSKASNKNYRDNFDTIFRKKEVVSPDPSELRYVAAYVRSISGETEMFSMCKPARTYEEIANSKFVIPDPDYAKAARIFSFYPLCKAVEVAYWNEEKMYWVKH